MPTTPQPPRKGHPGRPPKRDDGDKRASGKPRSYGQSAPMPGKDEQQIEGEIRAPVHKIARHEHAHQSVEDLAGEPMREEGEDEEPATASGAHGDIDGSSDELEALGDMPLGAEDDGPLSDKRRG
jgi:hypothetical protein